MQNFVASSKKVLPAKPQTGHIDQLYPHKKERSLMLKNIFPFMRLAALLLTIFCQVNVARAIPITGTVKSAIFNYTNDDDLCDFGTKVCSDAKSDIIRVVLVPTRTPGFDPTFPDWSLVPSNDLHVTVHDLPYNFHARFGDPVSKKSMPFIYPAEINQCDYTYSRHPFDIPPGEYYVMTVPKRSCINIQDYKFSLDPTCFEFRGLFRKMIEQVEVGMTLQRGIDFPDKYYGKVTIPANVAACTINLDPAAGMSVCLQPKLEVTPGDTLRLTARPNETITNAVKICNRGEANSILRIRDISKAGNWIVQVWPNHFDLDMNQCAQTEVKVVGPVNPGSYAGSIRILSNAANALDYTLPARLRVIAPKLIVTPVDTLKVSAMPGQFVMAAFQALNAGDDTLKITGITPSAAWMVSVTPSVVNLAPGKTQPFTVNIGAPVENGNYTGEIAITGNDRGQPGSVYKLKVRLQVGPPPCTVTPTAHFAWTPTSPSAGSSVQFTDQSSAGTGATIRSRLWNFGDGQTDTTENPGHVYNTNGVYTVTLTVTNSCNLSSSKSQSVTVVHPPCTATPTAGFTGSPTTGQAPLTVRFTDQSSAGTGATISSRLWNFGDGQTDTAENPGHVYSAAGVYTVTLTVTNSCRQTDGETKVGYVTVTSGVCTPHFTPVWSGNPYSPMRFWITKAMLSGVDLANCDEIAAFDGDKCVGVTKVTGPISTANMATVTASQDDDPNDGVVNGFMPGRPITFKVWDSRRQVEILLCTTTYKDLNGNPVSPIPTFEGNADFLVELECNPCSGPHNIVLTSGWNIVSSHIMPGNAEMKAVFQALMDSGKLIKVLDEQGRALLKVGGNWVNQIGNWQATEGYMVKVNGDATLVINGGCVQLPTDIPLSLGWNIISYPTQTPKDGLAVVQPIISVLIKVIDEQGKAILKVGGNWINQIGDFKAGEGYKVKVSANATLPVQAPSAAVAAVGIAEEMTAAPMDAQTLHYTPCWSGNPYNRMNFWFVGVNPAPQPGDEIAIYDGDKCVGTAGVTGPISWQNPLIVTCSQEDNPTCGFTVGHNFQIRCWNAAANKEIIAPLNKIHSLDLSGSNITMPLFEANSDYAFMLDDKSAVEDEPGTAKFQLYLAQSYPNPFNPVTTIAFMLPASGPVSLKIYNAAGQLVKTLADEDKVAGQYELTWNGTNDRGEALSSGIYLAVLNAGRQELTRKMTMIK